MAKKSALTSRFSDIISTAPEPTTLPEAQTTIPPQSHTDGETVKNTWVVKKSTVLALKRLAMDRFEQNGRRVSEGSLIDEAVEAFISGKNTP